MAILTRQNELISILQKASELAKSAEVDAFEIHASIDQGHVIGVRNLVPETLEFNITQHLSVHVYYQGKTGYAQTSDLSINSIKAIIQSAKTIAMHTEKDPFSGIIDAKELCTPKSLSSLYQPWEDFTIEKALELAKNCESYALDNQDISHSDGVSISGFEILHGFANSHGFLDVYPETRYSISAEFIADDKHGMQRDDAYYASRSIEGLPDTKHIAEEAINRTLARRNPQSIKTQNLPIIFSPQIAKSFISKLLTALKGSRQYHKNTFLSDVLDQRVLPHGINITENPLIKGAMGSQPYDDEGVNKGLNPIITDGVVNRYILNSYSARQLGMQSTGNAGGLSNVEIDAKHACSEHELITKMDHGIIIHETMGQGANLTTGDYSQGAMGFYVKNGQIQYPIDNFSVVSDLKTMLGNIQGISIDNVSKNSGIQVGSILINECHISGQ
ncbi:TldD/PmbA family protein [Fangia hongkongensis]|uniref:TldD/PmbA family protein n=1 Tax=Fangia hongkongensis TaxID=270495 RepID=UPI00036A1DA3|nr:metallopeptidase TldD-related protein [Fangia hongkongensis]MBK2125595.1 metalloprotease PmbA [Fangia hongkongensis]